MATGSLRHWADVIFGVFNPAGTGPSPTGDNLSVQIIPGSGTGFPVLGSGTLQGTGPAALIVTQPAFYQVVIDSATTASASATGTILSGIGAYRHASFLFNFTTMTGTVSFADFFVDSRLDGTTWVNIAHSDQITSALVGAGYQTILVLAKHSYGTSGYAGPGLLNITSDAGTGTVRNLIGWGNDFRIRRTVSGGTTAPIFTYTVTVNLTA